MIIIIVTAVETSNLTKLKEIVEVLRDDILEIRCEKGRFMELPQDSVRGWPRL
jgi:hypothetical protein